MRVAIAVFGNEISPRFCFAPFVRIYNATPAGYEFEGQYPLGPPDIVYRLDLLARNNVDVLLCGGFSGRYLPLAACYGIRVISGLVGDPEQILHGFIKGELTRYQFPAPRGCKRHRWRRGRRGGR